MHGSFMRLPTIHILYVFLFALVPLQGFCSYPLYLENEIHSALVSRDTYYRSSDVLQFLFPFPAADDTARLDSLRSKIGGSVFSRTDSATLPWPHLLAGLAASINSPKSMNEFYQQAFESASPDPGLSWVLAQEFERFGQPQWERMCLDQLKKIIVYKGASVSSACAQPLLYKAITSDKAGQPSIARDYVSLAQMFDRHSAWPMIRNIVSAFPLRVTTLYEESEKLTVFFLHSWEAQLSLAFTLLLWLRACLALLVLCAFLILGYKYSPFVLHWITELFPPTVSPAWKNYFSIIIVMSCISFGVLPFLWLLAFFTWRFCTRRDKWIMGIGCCLLILYPAGIRLEDMFRQCLSPEGSISLFRKALDEGYYGDLDRAVRTAAQAHSDDYLLQTAAAIVALKGDDLASAQTFARKAHVLRSDDPAVLLTEGIIFYRLGQFDKARSSYENCQQLFPGLVAAFFNCGQCYLVSNETIKGMEYLDRATKIDGAGVNAFISLNDELFAKKWPRLRQFMLPEYSVYYFWARVFPRYMTSWASSNALWGQSFMGMPLWGYCIVAPFLMIVLLLIDFFKWSTPGVVKIFRCKLCETAMCRRCKKGVICERCFEQLHQIRNENIRQRIIERILLKNRRIKGIGAALIDILFPGCGMLYRSNGFPAAALLLMIITASGYAFLLTIHSLPVAYPHWAVKEIVTGAYMTIPLLNAACAVRAALKIFKEFRT